MAQALKLGDQSDVMSTALIDQGLRLVLAHSDEAPRPKRVRLPVCRAGGGTLPGVDLDSAAATLDVMEGRS